jgi:hypothetical protein
MIQEEKDGFYRKKVIYRESRKSVLSHRVIGNSMRS